MFFVAEFFSMFSGAREGTVMDEAARQTLAERLQRQERERFAPRFEADSEDVVEGDDGSVFGGSFFADVPGTSAQVVVWAISFRQDLMT